MKAKIMAAMAKYETSLSFANLKSDLGDEMEGDFAVEVRPNLFYWINASESFVKALGELIADQTLKVKAVSPLIYAIDGLTLQLPIAKRLRKYQKPHWLPVVFDLDQRNAA